MLTGHPPFMGSTELEVYTRVTKLDYSAPGALSGLAELLTASLLEPKPHLRLGSLRNGAADVMAHPWFSGLDWVDLQAGAVLPPYTPPAPRAPSAEGAGANGLPSPPHLAPTLDCVLAPESSPGKPRAAGARPEWYWEGW